jgi:predicted dehydrogenase
MRLDWRKALAEFRPDIVAIATPGDVHHDIALAAAEMGVHLLCDKPLGIDALESRSMLKAVRQAGVKHAYASTSQYAPIFQYAHQLLADGAIGQMWQAEYINHFLFPPKARFSWFHQLSTGGGYLNTAFTHHLGQVLRVTGGKVRAATGYVTRNIGLVPVGAPVHDLREILGKPISEDEITQWRESDADIACVVLIRIEMPGGELSTVLFQNSAASIGDYSSYAAFYGTTATLRIEFGQANRILLLTTDQPGGKEMPIPQDIVTRLPELADHTQRDWNQLALEFVADIRGDGYLGYPTFYDGWVAGEIIANVRSANSWVSIPDNSV